MTAPVDGTVQAVPQVNTLQLTWSGFTDADTDVTGYRVAHAAGTPPSSCSTAAAVTGRSFALGGLANNVLYGIRVCAVDRLGNVSRGVTLQATPLPELDPPTATVTVVGGSNGWVSSRAIRLNIAAQDANRITGMCISFSSFCNSFIGFYSQPGVSLPLGDGTHIVNVKLRDIWGNTMSSPATVSVQIDSEKPTDGSMNSTGRTGAATVTWSGFSDARSGVIGYRIAYSRISAPTVCVAGTILEVPANQSSVDIQGLLSGPYGVRVCAIDAAGNLSNGRHSNFSVR
jgi:hypothetical protein